MNKEQKALQKIENTQLRKQKKKTINERKKSEKESDLLNCPNCHKPKENVKERPARVGTFTSCYLCYKEQILMS